MRSLGRVLAAEGAPPPHDDYWYGPRGFDVGGMTVNDATALSWDALYAAVTYISEDIAKVPLSMFEHVPEGKRPAREHELQETLHDLPNEYQTAIEFREWMTAVSILRDEAIAEQRDGRRTRGGPRRRELVPLAPDLIRKDRSPSGERRYWYRDPEQGFAERLLLAEDLLILRGRLGKGIVELARESIALNLAMERHTGFMFSRGARFAGVVKHPGKLDDPTRTALRKALDQYSIGGPRAGRPLLLEDGMDWVTASMTAADQELLASRRFGITQAARWTRIPPHKLMELERSTNNNIDRQSIDYVVDTLLGWAKRWEQIIYRDLLRPAEQGRFFAEHILDALLRGDPAARSKAYALAIQWGWMTRNEVRKLENLNTLDGLDDPLTPLNMTTGDDVDEDDDRRDARVMQLAAGPSREVSGRLRLLAAGVASRLVRLEVNAIRGQLERIGSDPGALQAAVREFYEAHAQRVAADLHIPDHDARRYCREQLDALISRGPAAMDDWLTDRVETLTDLAMDKPEAIAA